MEGLWHCVYHIRTFGKWWKLDCFCWGRKTDALWIAMVKLVELLVGCNKIINLDDLPIGGSPFKTKIAIGTLMALLMRQNISPTSEIGCSD